MINKRTAIVNYKLHYWCTTPLSLDIYGPFKGNSTRSDSIHLIQLPRIIFNNSRAF